MWKYAVVEISGRQYKIEPDKSFDVDFLGDIQTYVCERVLLKMEEDRLELGKPFLNEKFIFEVVADKKLPKVRVATYKAKANTRKVKGSRRRVSTVRLSSKAASSGKEKEEIVKKA